MKLKVVAFLLQLKSPMQIMMGVNAEQQAEMENMIRELEAENRYFNFFKNHLLYTFSDSH